MTMALAGKDEVARQLAQGHFAVDSGVLKIFRLVTSPEREADPGEPIRLLEVYQYAFPSGIMPVYFPPHPASGQVYPAEIVQIAPEEFDRIRNEELRLPNGWSMGPEYLKGDQPGSLRP